MTRAATLTLMALIALTLGSLGASADVGAAGAESFTLAQSTDAQELFAFNCGNCHMDDGRGESGVTPPLAGNPAATDPVYVEETIRNGLDGPLEVLGETYDSIMYPVPISDEEIATIVAYVVTLASTEVTDTPAVTVAPRVADPETGQRLFNGSDRFDEGGPACRSCHTAGSESFWGGSVLGPDLNTAAANFGGEAGLRGWLANPPAPTMRPLFADHPLSSTEVDDLAAYLATLDGQETASGVDQLLLAGIGGFVVLIGLMAWLFRGPQQTYAEQLRSKR